MTLPTKESKLTTGAIVATALMLFSMFFGAGNLIFPPVLGTSSGENFTPAIIGFLLGGVALPAVTIIAMTMSGSDIRDLGVRAGNWFNISFAVIVYLSIGAFYAIPRTSAVSYSMIVQPVLEQDSTLASVGFNALFFAVALLLALNPTGIVDKLGKFLTPALLVLLAVLVVLAIANLRSDVSPATEKYATAPLTTGLLEGYMTMDSLAALAFGILVISSLKYKSGHEGKALVKPAIIASLIASALLAIIYLGLGYVGRIMPDGQSYQDGASLLSGAARLTMGTPGQVVFGLIVLLACMTTAVGLLAATSEFFNRLLPDISYKAWLVIFSLISFFVGSMGLSKVLSIAAPLITFIYPVAITLVALTILELSVGKLKLLWGFRLPVWAVTIWSALTTLGAQGITAAESLVSWAPLHDVSLAWLLPAFTFLAIGGIIDYTRRS